MMIYKGLFRASAVAMVAMTGLAATAASAIDRPEFAGLVEAVAQTELQEWITDPIFLYAIREQNENNGRLRQAKIDFLDQEWRAENGKGPMIYDLLDRQASIILRDRRELSQGVITEIILMDRYGLNVAISDPTSDFWQGDEAKYQETYLRGAGAVHVGEIEFDDSTQLYQTQVSMTVVDPENGNVPIGAVTFGINLEVLQALSN
ncbi:MAG: hypothetical protein AAF675_15435 [Pseudomonadota bacterium]